MRSATDEMIFDLAAGVRDPTGQDLEKIRLHVAEAGFDPTRMLPADQRVVGMHSSRGSVIRQGDPLSTGELHYLRHAVRQEEWPVGTSLGRYQDSLSALAASLRVGILLRQIAHFGWHVTIIGRSGRWKGRLGSDWMIVEYRVSDGYWVTGYQPRDGLLFANRRPRRRWLRLPT